MFLKKDFLPYLNLILPSVVSMATLNPEMSIQGIDKSGDLIDVLSEVKPDEVKQR